jgi:hypothetical protein
VEYGTIKSDETCAAHKWAISSVGLFDTADNKSASLTKCELETKREAEVSNEGVGVNRCVPVRRNNCTGSLAEISRMQSL